MRWLAALLLLGWSSSAMAQCTGSVPFGCVTLPTPATNDLVFGGSQAAFAGGGGQGSGAFTMSQLLAMDHSSSVVTGNSVTNTLGTWESYLAGVSNPNPIVFGGMVTANNFHSSGATLTNATLTSPTLTGTANAANLNVSGNLVTTGAASLTLNDNLIYSTGGDLELQAPTGNLIHLYKTMEITGTIFGFDNQIFVPNTAITTLPNFAGLNLGANLSGTLSNTVSPYFYQLATNDAVIANEFTSGGQVFGPYQQMFNVAQVLTSGFDGPRIAMGIAQTQEVASASGNFAATALTVYGKYISAGEGGTGGPLVRNWKGGATLINPNMDCDTVYSGECLGEEFDLSLETASYTKGILALHYGSGDTAHGYAEDATLSLSASPKLSGQAGGGILGIEFGGGSQFFPLDPLQAASGNTKMIGIRTNSLGNLVGPGIYTATYGIDIHQLYCIQDAWWSTGYQVDCGGQQYIGPGKIGITSTGIAITATNVSEQSATVYYVGDGNSFPGDELIDPIGGQWNIATVYAYAFGSTPATPGSGYTAGGTFPIAGATCTTTPTLTLVEGTGAQAGTIVSFTVAVAGNCTAVPSSPVSVTGASGSGATFYLGFKPITGYAATCPTSPTSVEGGNSGNLAPQGLNGITLTITCSAAASNVTLGASGNIVQIGSGAVLRLSPFTIGTLPTCNSAATGDKAYVSNGVASPTYNATVSTTGTSNDPVFCNGTNWTYH